MVYLELFGCRYYAHVYTVSGLKFEVRRCLAGVDRTNLDAVVAALKKDGYEVTP